MSVEDGKLEAFVVLPQPLPLRLAAGHPSYPLTHTHPHVSSEQTFISKVEPVPSSSHFYSSGSAEALRVVSVAPRSA